MAAASAPGAGAASGAAKDVDIFRDLLSTFVLDPRANDTPDDTCLISQDPLAQQQVCLPCGHKFNYDVLFREVLRQKHRRRTDERPRLGEHQLRCPYCNTIHDGLLPPCQGYGATSRVNSPLKWALAATTCQHVYARGRNQGDACGGVALCGSTRCKRHAPRPAPE